MIVLTKNNCLKWSERVIENECYFILYLKFGAGRNEGESMLFLSFIVLKKKN